jgi:hypothetical protein
MMSKLENFLAIRQKQILISHDCVPVTLLLVERRREGITDNELIEKIHLQTSPLKDMVPTLALSCMSNS